MSKLVLITGGSRGIGAATALLAARQGYAVAVNYTANSLASGGQPERAQQLAPQVPMQRPGTAEEVAQAIVWLLGEEASYTSGALLDVAGGR